MLIRVFTFVVMLACFQAGLAPAAEAYLLGELGLSLTTNDQDPRLLRASARYQPDLTARLALGQGHGLTAFASGEALYQGEILSWSEADGEEEFSLYRLWLRYSSARTELRLGRQKLSFGSATLLRPLACGSTAPIRATPSN
jgi:hypothetical protein